MYWRVLRLIGLACIVMALGMMAQEAKKKEWTDRAEFDLYNAAANEPAPAKKIELLNQWKQKYPNTQFAHERLTLYVNAYAAAGKYAELADTAKQILQIDPQDLTALYWLTSLTRSLGATSPDFLNTGEKVALSFLNSLNTIFAAAKKPAGTSDDAWTKARNDMELLCLKTLGWAAMTKKNNASAEKYFAQIFAKTPNDAEVTYWMYTVIRAGGARERSSEALFYLARAASLTGPGALPAAEQKKVDEFFAKAYTSWHGEDAAGLAQLRKLALASTAPPAGFRIETAAEIAVRKQNEFMKEKPQLAFWLGIKKELAAEEGASFFQSRVKGAALPGKIEGTEYTKMKGKLVTHRPAANPKEIVLNMDTEGPAMSGEVTLKLEVPLRGRADPGTLIEFEGVASEFTKEPFMLTFEVEKGGLTGWPAQPATPPPAKKAGKKGKK